MSLMSLSLMSLSLSSSSLPTNPPRQTTATTPSLQQGQEPLQWFVPALWLLRMVMFDGEAAPDHCAGLCDIGDIAAADGLHHHVAQRRGFDRPCGDGAIAGIRG